MFASDFQNEVEIGKRGFPILSAASRAISEFRFFTPQRSSTVRAGEVTTSGPNRTGGSPGNQTLRWTMTPVLEATRREVAMWMAEGRRGIRS